MALKDLVAQTAALKEDAIERIVKDYIRYDVDELELGFTPSFARLPSRAKVMVYLVAVQGWPFVVDEPVSTSAKPAEIENRLGIPGGTLRPVLKDLKDRHLLVVKNGEYGVRASNLDAIERELDGAMESAPPRARRKPSRRATATPKEGAGKGAEQKLAEGQGKRRRAGATGQRQRFDEWVKEGFFDQPRTLREVKDRFHEEAIIIPTTSIPQYLLAAVRDGRLSRTKMDVNGKARWVYRSKA